MTDHQPTHREILARLESVEARLASNAGHSDDFRVEVATSIASMMRTLRVIGEAVEKIEAKVYAYDILKARMLGMLATGAVAVAMVWWVIGDKVEKFLKG